MAAEPTDCGAEPVNAEVAIRAHMQTAFKDPESARYRFVGPPKKYFNGLRCIYQIEAFVNAKNSYGAYVGERRVTFFLRDGVALGHREHER